MKKAFVVAAVLGCALSSQATIYHFSSFMTAGQEVHNPASPAFGSSGFSIDTTTGQLFGSFTAINLVNGNTSVTDYHIHQAPMGVAGPVRLWNNQPGNSVITGTNGTDTTWTVTFNLTLDQRNGSTGVLFNYDGDSTTGVDFDDVNTFVNVLLSGNGYTNVHTTFSGAGEIRGQIAQVVPEPASMAALGIGAFALMRRRRRRS